MLSKSIQEHQNYTLKIAKGKGIDRHLYALYSVSSPDKIHEFFKDPLFQRFFHFDLSTSQIYFVLQAEAWFLSPYETGYGIVYKVEEN